MVLVIVLTTLHGINIRGLPVALGLLYLLFLRAAWPHLIDTRNLLTQIPASESHFGVVVAAPVSTCVKIKC